MLSFDRYSRDDVVGEVMVELEGMDLSGSDTCPLSLAREITPRSDKLRSQGRGELLVSLCHQVIDGSLLFPTFFFAKINFFIKSTRHSTQLISLQLFIHMSLIFELIQIRE